MANFWIGVDLDGTLAKHDGRLEDGIGPALPEMLKRVKKWVKDGREVRIFTARADSSLERAKIKKWLEDNELPALAVTNTKDWKMAELWDDRAVRVLHNADKVCSGCRDASIFSSQKVLSDF